MFQKTGHVAIVIALVAMLGGHWAILQTLAWTNMFAVNLRGETISIAVGKTFDGKHPCCLCKAIAQGKKSERKSDVPPQLKKFEFVSERTLFVFSAPQDFYFAAERLSSVPDFFIEPSVPPPRGIFC